MSGTERRAALLRAGALADAGRPADAMAVYQLVLREEPDDAHALCGMSRCLGKLGDPAEGLRLAERAAALAPGDDWPHRLRSAHLVLLGRPRPALEAARAARALAPTGFAAQLSVFEAEVATGARRAAGETARSMVATHPAQPESHNAVGRAAMLARRWTDAEAAFGEALRLAPHEAVYRSNMALALERRGRRREAMQHFRGAVQSDPGSAAARRQLVHAIDRRLAVAGVGAGLAGAVAANVALQASEPVGLALGAAALALVLAVLAAVRWWRLRQLDETLRTFYRHERRRWRALRWEVAACIVVAGAACLAVVGAVAVVAGSGIAAAAVAALLLVGLRYAGLPVWRRRVLPRLQARHGVLRIR